MSQPRKKVQCWIFSRALACKPQCLLLKTNRLRGEFWQPVTGTVEDNEGFFEAACREPLEETGFTFESVPLDTAYEFEFTSRFGPARERVYALTVTGTPPPRLDYAEHCDYQWTSPAQALQLLRFPSNIEGLKRAHLLVFGKDP